MLGRALGRLPRPRLLRRVHLLWFYRTFARRKPRAALRYALRGRETSNFTYDIANREELAAFAAGALGRDESEVLRLFAEIEGDEPLLDALGASLRRQRDRNQRPMLGRRIVWYAAARIARPQIAVETGTHDGLGSAVIARALQRNEEEGDAGRLLTFDVDPATGWLIPAQVRSHVDRHIGDVRETLAAALVDLPVGMFVHDSVHTYEHELFELRTVMAAAAPGIVLISDNAHASRALADFAQEQNASFHFVPEIPVDHFYPGGGVGIAVVR
jgi:predicted O-methyltransferase YrrM